jgi:hypothetical protein
MIDAAEYLHETYNPKWSHIPPVRIKGFNRVDLAKLFAELGYKRGAEIGVADGRNSLTLCENIPDLELWCIDPWEPYRSNPRGGGKGQQHGNYDLAQERLADYNVHFMRDFSLNAAQNWDGPQLDFVYIDGNHKFDYVIIDLVAWNPMVRKDGMVAGHDYYRFRWAGVVDAVNAYVTAHQINEWFIDDTRETGFFWGKGRWRK